MEFFSRRTKVIDDLLFIDIDLPENGYWATKYRCIHIPSLVISTQLPGGTLSLTENAFAVLLPKCIMESHGTGADTEIYSIPDCPPTHPRYCFIIKRTTRPTRVDWEVLEVEIDLSIPGPIKIFSRVSRQYTQQVSTRLIHDNDNDLLIYLPLDCGSQPSASLRVQFLRVGKAGEVRVARLGGVDEMRLSRLSVDNDAGYVIIWATENWPQWTRCCSFIWWLDERKPGDVVYSRRR